MRHRLYRCAEFIKPYSLRGTCGRARPLVGKSEGSILERTRGNQTNILRRWARFRKTGHKGSDRVRIGIATNEGGKTVVVVKVDPTAASL